MLKQLLSRCHFSFDHFSLCSLSLGLLTTQTFCCFADQQFNEEFNSAYESESLNNICQVTYPEMGFEKCGEGYFSPDGTHVIFQAVPKGQAHYQIYVMNLDEGIPRRVSTGFGACTCAYFKPDGTKIIFASSHEDPMLYDEDALFRVPGYKRGTNTYVWELTPYMNIYEANTDGTDLVPLTTGPAYSAECAYSSDGLKIVFASNRSGSMNIYTMNSDGSDITQLTFDDSCYNGGPFFSPDSTEIIFRADRQKAHYLQLRRINTNGTDDLQITDNGAVNWAPYWHPNGKVIAFTTSLHGHAHYEIYAMSLENNQQSRITHNESFDGLPVFNNDGTKMLWTSKRSADGSCQLFIADFTLPEQLQ